MWQAHLAVAAATGRRTWRWKVEWQLPLPRKDFTLTVFYNGCSRVLKKFVRISGVYVHYVTEELLMAS